MKQQKPSCQIQLTSRTPYTPFWSEGKSLTRGKIYTFFEPIEEEDLLRFKEAALFDPAIHECTFSSDWKAYILVYKKPGVTDDEGLALQQALYDFLEKDPHIGKQTIFSHEIYLFKEEIPQKTLLNFAKKHLGNPLIHNFEAGLWSQSKKHFTLPTLEKDSTVEHVCLPDDAEALCEISKTRHLSLNADEMLAIKKHFGSTSPTDCELEIIAQTWSEHCKHKEFNAEIHFINTELETEKTIHSLFQTYIKGATDVIEKKFKEAGIDWLLKVFSDNAGMVAFDQKRAFVWKVETHNTPSALDPYGGAITGILGNNRDILGTGIGGAEPILNTNVLCFASPNYSKPLLKGQLHPSKVMKGVVQGIMDGGNKSGIPTVGGAVIFDDRYGGKPLVFCGTGGIIPRNLSGKDSSKKPIHLNDLILVIGGRVGKDGIHGATLSSLHIEDSTPQNMVQIGSPFTQKKLSDFLIEASRTGLVKTCTDNGAGGLSSSIGELAQISDGAEVHLEKVPLKYSGLKPWEIFVSESQERMTIVIDPEIKDEIFQLAAEFEVEISEIGRFTNSGKLEVFNEGNPVASLNLEFLHNGLPKKKMEAIWNPKSLKEPTLPSISNFGDILLQLLRSLNICSKEAIIRRYDHEVQGKSIIKPLMGPEGIAPQDAAVLRIDQYCYEGIAVSHGILPRYGDIDPYQMSAGAFDEGVRQIIAVGGKLPNPEIFWSVNDNFCLPNSEYHPESNPTGKEKLGALVRMCEALYDLSTHFNIPLTSGKDSMKNDLKDGKNTISIPPTILYSMASKIEDIRKVCTTEFKQEGDLIYLLGKTYDEMGGSEFYQLFGELGKNVPIVRPKEASELYKKVSSAHEKDLLLSCHDLSDGGLAVALAESCFGGNLGAKIELESIDLFYLFSESHSRFLVSIPPERQGDFEKHFGSSCTFLGKVIKKPQLIMNPSVLNLSLKEMKEAWLEGLRF